MEEKEEDKHSLLKPLIIPSLIPSSTTNTTLYSLCNPHHHHQNDPRNNNTKLFISDKSIIHRVILLLLVSILSIWANHEASKTFQITLVNDTNDTPAARRFALNYVSNDRAARILLNTSSFVENLLYPHHNDTKKHVESVTLCLTRRNTTTVYAAGEGSSSYVIDISPALFEYDGKNHHHEEVAVVGAVLRGMARVWLWNGGSRAPIGLLDGMAEYIAELAGFRREGLPECGQEEEALGGLRWWEDKEPAHVARLLHYCEDYYKKGFIRRLNEAMRDTWHDRVVEDVLGVPLTTMRPCGGDNVSWPNQI